ncbi:hypothetical protein O6H91_11G083700 [Diphasiastrum complanatum]|uniref:Uncharacterized protein n=1 Tax=Diphasiastrum complanatum TaxID=34168 RepID=A0ACC2CBK2_DIPCM|nr:hypothetical protein O6H91_11G083700 [Diphasiastrum complanatum]
MVVLLLGGVFLAKNTFHNLFHTCDLATYTSRFTDLYYLFPDLQDAELISHYVALINALTFRLPLLFHAFFFLSPSHLLKSVPPLVLFLNLPPHLVRFSFIAIPLHKVYQIRASHSWLERGDLKAFWWCLCK